MLCGRPSSQSQPGIFAAGLPLVFLFPINFDGVRPSLLVTHFSARVFVEGISDWSCDVDECEGCRFPRWHICRQQGPYSSSKVSHTRTAGTLQSLSACHITSAHAHYAHTHPCPKHPHEPNLFAKTHTHIAPIHTPRPRRHTRVQSDISRSYHPTLSQQTQSKTLLTGSLCKHQL